MPSATVQHAYAIREGVVDGHRTSTIEVVFEEGYPNALRGCLAPPPAVSPGDCFPARFTITAERRS